jgi:hypothetical protein
MQDYSKGPVIGEGTYGSVIRATHKQTGREVAIKKVRLQPAASAQADAAARPPPSSRPPRSGYRTLAAARGTRGHAAASHSRRAPPRRHGRALPAPPGTRQVRVGGTRDGVHVSALREIRALRELGCSGCPHVVELLDVFPNKAGSSLCLVFEHLDWCAAPERGAGAAAGRGPALACAEQQGTPCVASAPSARSARRRSVGRSSPARVHNGTPYLDGCSPCAPGPWRMSCATSRCRCHPPPSRPTRACCWRRSRTSTAAAWCTAT